MCHPVLMLSLHLQMCLNVGKSVYSHEAGMIRKGRRNYSIVSCLRLTDVDKIDPSQGTCGMSKGSGLCVLRICHLVIVPSCCSVSAAVEPGSGFPGRMFRAALGMCYPQHVDLLVLSDRVRWL